MPLKEMGFECVGWSEIDKYAIRTFEVNFPEMVGKNYGDITKIDCANVPDFNLLVGGSPCQDFSVSKNNREGLAGKRSGLFEEYLRILKEKQPDNFIWENVKGVLSCNKGEDWKYIQSSFVAAGYSIKYQVLNTKDYEIPQNRERVYVVGQREDLTPFEFVFPPKRKLKVFLKDIIENGYVDRETSHCIKKNFAFTSESDLKDYLKESRGQIVFVDRDVSYCIDSNYHKGSSLELYKNHLPQVVFNRPVQVDKIGKGGQGQRIYSLSGTSCTLQSGGGGQGAKTGLYQFGDKFRKLTPLECFRLQGFPDEFCHRAKEIGISNTQLYRQAGNAVTVNVVRAILESLYFDNIKTKQLGLF